MKEDKQKSKVVQALEEMIDNDQIVFEFDLWNGPGSLLAFVRVIITPLVLKGFRVMESSYPNWRGEHISVMPPMIYRGKKEPLITFFIEDKQLWYKFAGKIIEKYFLAKKNKYENKKRLTDNDYEEIDKATSQQKQ